MFQEPAFWEGDAPAEPLANRGCRFSFGSARASASRLGNGVIAGQGVSPGPCCEGNSAGFERTNVPTPSAMNEYRPLLEYA